MYIAILVIHPDFDSIDNRYINNFKEVIVNCVNDNNFVHIFFSSGYGIHRFDKLFSQSRVRLYHNQLNNNFTQIQSSRKLYHDCVEKTGFDYNWLVKIRPDLLFFDKNILHGIKTKYNENKIHARARYYIGPLHLKKHQRSHWGDSYKQYPLDKLLILDDQIYMIPFKYFSFAFDTNIHPLIETKDKLDNFNKINSFADISINNIVDSPEKQQTLIWMEYEIPLQITELYCLKISDLKMYNLYINI